MSIFKNQLMLKNEEIEEITAKLHRYIKVNDCLKDITTEQKEEIDKLKVEVASSWSKTSEYINKYTKMRKERDMLKAELKKNSKVGSWQYVYDEKEDLFFRKKWICSSCGMYQTYGETNYCPKCGCLMIKETEDASF